MEEDNVSLVIIDSINGFMQAMPHERLLTVQVHELLSFLSNRGVSVIMTLVQRGIFGAPVSEAAEVSFLADSVFPGGGAFNSHVAIRFNQGGSPFGATSAPMTAVTRVSPGWPATSAT